MAISYFQDKIIVSDDYQPDREQLVIVLPATSDEVKTAIRNYLVNAPVQDWSAIRQERNRLLAECDWTQIGDATADKTAWATYRQALRDITLQPNPLEVQWPVPPQ